MDSSADLTTEANGEPLVIEEAEGAPSTLDDHQLTEPQARPPNHVKIDALRRLKALESRGKTVGTHLDELRALLTFLFQQMPD